MYGLEPGQYAKKYSFWAREYVAREQGYISIEEMSRPYETIAMNSWKVHRTNNNDECSFWDYISRVMNNSIECQDFEKEAVSNIVEIDHVCLDVCGYIGGEKPTNVDEIIESMCINEDLTVKFNTPVRMYTSLATWEGASKYFTGEFERPIVEFDGKRVIRLNIEYDKPIDLILNQVRYAIDCARQTNGDPELFIKLNMNYYSLEAHDKHASLRCGYTPSSDKVRSIGLWLFDYVKQAGNVRGSVKRAISEIGKRGYLSDLSLDAEDSDLRFYLRRTTACIEAREVLPFTKKGTQKNKLVPGTDA